MMFNFVEIYLFIYSLVFIQILLVSIFLTPNYVLFESTLQMYLLYIWHYTLYGKLIFFFFLGVAGMPPLLVFFFKMHFFCTIISKFNFFLIILLYCYTLLTMFYYMQIFNNKNEESCVLEYWIVSQKKTKNSWIHIFSQHLNGNNTVKDYYNVVRILSVLCLIYFGGFFYSDLLYILESFSN